jgi:general secretion pathway protein A
LYENYWRLRDKPFRNTPDPRYFHFSRQHEEALARALYVVTEGQGAMLLTGECGCGKTLVTRALVDELDPARFEVALIPYPNLNPEELIREMLRQFGFDAEGWTKQRMLERLSAFLHRTRERGASTLAIVDEGQLVADDLTLEEIRLLLNFQQDQSFCLTLILVGQPELRERVETKPQLSQRLTIRHHIGPLSPEDARKYLVHRLAVAGGGSDIFTGGAEDILIEESRGIPRRINLIADLALLAGFGKNLPLIDEDLMREVVRDLGA